MKRDRIMRDRLREQIVVTLKTGETFSGVFYDYDEKTLVLLQAEAVTAESRTKADGAVLIQWDNVRFWQKP